jgi:ATP-binding cassette, subfamily B, bacterial MsbA
MTENKSTQALVLYRRLFTFVKPCWLMLLLGIVANIFYSAIDAGLTYMVRIFFEKGFINIDIPFVKMIPLILFLAVTLRGVVGSLGGYCMTWVARTVVKVLRQEIFSHIVRLPADYYDEATSGKLLSKILYDVEQVAQVSADALTDFIQNLFLLIGLLTVMFLLNWQLSLTFLTTIPFIGVIVNATNKRVRRLSHQGQQAMGMVTEVASEAIEGYRVIRIFGGEQYEIEKFNQATELSRINDMKVAVSKALNVVGVQAVIAVGIAIIILAAIKLAEIVTISPGAFVAIIAAMIQLLKPLKVLATLNSVFQRGLAGAESIFSMLDRPLEAEDGRVLSGTVSGMIHFEDLTFAYRQGKTVLHDVSFTVPAGKTVALVGQSGSGKTTLSTLLPRFYELQQGRITLDGIDISELSLSSLRRQIALVSQQVTLFNDTMANNIAYGCFDVSREKIIEAAKLAYADEFISRLPQGYDTPIGENGVLLSGGQRQRLAIARAILKNAPILILDEATSALDSESEHYIQKALEVVMKNRTTLVIAHRLSTIKSADKIIVLHQGRLVEEGTHQSLLELDGYYAKLCNTQELVSAD